MNVRVVENKVKSHVGKVYDTQNRMLGSTPSIDRMIRPSKPNVDFEATCVVPVVASPVCRASSALARAAVDASATDLPTADAAMIKTVGDKSNGNTLKSPNAILLRSTVVV